MLGEPGALSGEMIGGSARYLAAVARLGADLAARGRVLPALCAEDGGHAAKWRPVLSGADAERARELAAGMPAMCRAADAGDRSSALILTGALDDLTDAAARARLAGRPLLPARRGRRPARIPVAERWIVRADVGRQPGRGHHNRRRAGGSGACRPAGRLALRRAAPGRPGAHLLPADRAARGGERGGRAAVPPRTPRMPAAAAGTPDEVPGEAWRGRVRAAVDRRPEPDAARGRHLGGRVHGRLGRGRDQAPRGGTAGRAGPAARLFPELDRALRGPRARPRSHWTPRGRSVPAADRPAAVRRRVRRAAAGLGARVPAGPEAHHPVQAAPRERVSDRARSSA